MLYYVDNNSPIRDFWREFSDPLKATKYLESIPKPRILYDENFKTIREDL